MSERHLAAVFVELADTLVDDFDVVDFLQTLTERCVELLEASAAGLMLADEKGVLQLVAGTSTVTRALELFELEKHDGPCLDSYATGESILNISIASETAAQRWPVFTPAAAQAGVRSTSALPMRLRGQVVGALNLFSDRHESLSGTSLALGQAMADVATIGLLNERSLRQTTILSQQLQGALNSRTTIEQAKGVLAAHGGISIDEAFVRLRQHARSHGVALTEVASAVVDGELRLNLEGHSTPGHVSGSALESRADSSAAAARTALQPLDLQVLRLIAAGNAGDVVAHQLQITVSEVTQRLVVIRGRLGVASTAAAVQAARRSGLL